MTDAPERFWRYVTEEGLVRSEPTAPYRRRDLGRSTEYVRADLFAALEAENAALRAEIGKAAADSIGEFNLLVAEIEGLRAALAKQETPDA